MPRPRSRSGENHQRLSPLPAHLQSAAFTIDDGMKSGLTRNQMRHSRLVSLSRGIRVLRSADLDLPSRVRPFTRVSESSAASHETAARLWNFPDPEGRLFDRRIHISRPSGGARMQRPGVVGHRSRLLPDEVTYAEGLYVTTRVRTWLDLAASLALDDLIVITDHLIRVPRPEFEGREEPYATRDGLLACLKQHPHRNGLRNAREALTLARVGADSPPETRLRLAMNRACLPEPEVNKPITDGDGNELHCPDLSLPEYRIAIEYEGEGHSQSSQVDRDIEREERARAAGWDEIRISKRHMADGAKRAVEKIVAGLRDRGWEQESAA